VSSVETSIGQGGDFAKGPAGVTPYDTSPSGLGLNPTYLAPSSSATATVSTPSGTVVALASWPPSSPSDGQIAILQLSSTYDPVGGKAIRWSFAYNASDGVWDFTGGPPLYAEGVSLGSLSFTNSYTSLTGFPSLVIPRAGDYQIGVGGIASAGSPYSAAFAYSIGGGASSDSDAGWLNTVSSTAAPATGYADREKTGISTSATVQAQGRSASGSVSITVQHVWLKVTPVRIT